MAINSALSLEAASPVIYFLLSY